MKASLTSGLITVCRGFRALDAVDGSSTGTLGVGADLNCSESRGGQPHDLYIPYMRLLLSGGKATFPLMIPLAKEGEQR
jgi:hypothetical protein